MFSDEPFLGSILASPDEDAPRLVYADWLEEHGATDRAEVIRGQCAGPDTPRIRELLANRGMEWAGPAARRLYSCIFRRGFVEEVALDARLFLELGEQLFATAPVRLVRLIGAKAVLDRLADSPLLAKLRALHLTGCQLGDEGVEQLAVSPHLRNLKTLRLGQNSLSDRAMGALSSSPHLSGLNVLVLQGNLIGDQGAHVLADCELLSELRSLDLSDNLIGDSGAAALARAYGLDRLERLNLEGQFKGGSVVFRNRPYPIQPVQQQALAARFGPATCAF